MKTRLSITLLILLALLFNWSCEDDLVLPDGQDIELRGKGGKGNGGNNGGGNNGGGSNGITVTMTDLGTFSGGSVSYAHGVDVDAFTNDVWVVGDADLANDERHGFLWKLSEGVMHDLGSLHQEQPYSSARDIIAPNSTFPEGIIAGYSSSLIPPYYSSEAATWTADPVSEPTSVNPSNSVNSNAYAINSLGDLAGSRVDTCGYIDLGYGPCTEDSPGGVGNSIWSAFMWENTGTGYNYHDLGHFWRWSHGLGINTDRVAVGYSEYTEDPYQRRAFRWENGVLDMIPGLEDEFSEAWDINDYGEIVGWMRVPNPRGFIYTKDDQGQWSVLELPTLGKSTYARSISQEGYVTGHSFYKNSVYHAFLWRDDIGMLDLAKLSGIKGNYDSYAYGVADDLVDPKKVYVAGYLCTTSMNCNPHATLWTITFP